MNIALVPARCGSKSIPFKNIKELNGKPLIYWVLNALEKADNIDTVYLATDCIEIEKIAKGLNFNKLHIYKREAKNAQDTSSTESVLLECIKNLEISPNDTMFLVQATAPLLTSLDIQKAYKQYKNSSADSLLTCVRKKEFIWDENGIPINYDYKKRPRRQEFNGHLVENGAMYISNVKNIIKSQNRISGKISIYAMPEYSAVNIDEEIDWIIAEKLIEKYILHK